jgi:hypothetical protein
MGTYSDLFELSQEPSVPPPDAAKTPKVRAVDVTPTKPSKAAAKSTAAPQAESLPPMSKPRRNLARESFDVYQDQHELLRQVSLTAKLGGEQLSISEMVREALDEYIHRKALRL